MSRLIDADNFVERLKHISDTANTELSKMITSIVVGLMDSEPTAYNVDKVLEQIENLTSYYKDCTKYCNKDAEQQKISYGTTLNYEVASYFDDILEIVKRGGVDA